MEKKELNLAEILKDCPKGTTLYSPMCGTVLFDEVNFSGTIVAKRPNGVAICFTPDGHYFLPVEPDAECMLFPSRDNRDWSTFKVGESKWDPRTLQPFDKVLVRDYDTDPWKGDFFVSSDWPVDNEYYAYMAVSSYYKMCIPYNEETRHLLGTNQEAPEYYRV